MHLEYFLSLALRFKQTSSLKENYFWNADIHPATLQISQHFVKPEGSLSCSQESNIGFFLSQIEPVNLEQDIITICSCSGICII
jgi:hypothetical protein